MKDSLYVIRMNNYKGNRFIFAVTDSLEYCKKVKAELPDLNVTYKVEPDSQALNYIIDNPTIIVKKKGHNQYIPY